MARFTSALHPRDGQGRFRGKAQARRARKIKRLTAKNNRVIDQYLKDSDLHGTGLGHSIERRVIKRAVKVNKLQARQDRAKARIKARQRRR